MLELSSYSFSCIGAGKIACSLAPALSSVDFSIGTVISRSAVSAEELAAKVGATASISLTAVSPDASEIVILSVPDNEIGSVASQIAAAGIDCTGKIFFHLSGALSSRELLPLRRLGAKTASFHIMKSFPSKMRQDISGSVVAVESPDDDVSVLLCSLAEKLQMRSFIIAAEKKSLYHMMGVASSNFIAANYFFLENLYRESGITGISLKELTAGIISASMSNAETLGAVASLSGPVERGDTETIRGHLRALPAGTLRDYYISSSALLADIALEKGSITDEKRKEILEILHEQ